MKVKAWFLNLSTAIAGSALLVACSTATEQSDKVAQERIYQTYSASYDQATNDTVVTAEFRFGDISGTTLRLVGKSQVAHASAPLRERSVLGTYYRGQQDGFSPLHTFKFTDTEGREYINSASIRPIGFSIATPNELSRSFEQRILWEGEPLSEGETITVTIADPRTGSPVVSSSGKAGDVSVLIPQGVMSTLSPGETKMDLLRRRYTPLRQGTETGGLFSTSYKTLERKITITD